jgi:hypothetical protein
VEAAGPVRGSKLLTSVELLSNKGTVVPKRSHYDNSSKFTPFPTFSAKVPRARPWEKYILNTWITDLCIGLQLTTH